MDTKWHLLNKKGILTMQINNNPSAQNFGMALRIKPEALEVLQKESSTVLSAIERAGKELTDTKFWDVEVGVSPKGTLTYKVDGNYCANAYVDGVRGKQLPKDEFLTIQSTWAGTDGVGGHKVGEKCETVMKMANAQAAKDAYARLNASGYDIDNAVEAAKVLDEWTTFSKSVDDAKAQDAAIRAAKANDLFEKYGVKN